ncbi:MAG: hypothetical protein AAFY41_18170, partial [Bacteroidota bacterium]
MRILFIYISLVIVFISLGCNEDSFSQTVEVNLPIHEPLPALSLHIRTGDTTGIARLGLSYGILENEPLENPPGEIRLFRNGDLIGSSTVETNQGQFGLTEIALTTAVDASLSTYQLTGELQGYPTVSVEQVMPTPVNLTDQIYTVDGGINSEGETVDEITLTIADED